MKTVNYKQYINHLHFLQDSYNGGEDYKNPKYCLQTAKRAVFKDSELTGYNSKMYSSYLIPHEEEDPSSFASRRELAKYLNIVEPVVSAYCSPLEQVKRTIANEELKTIIMNKEFYSDMDYQAFIKYAAKQDALFGFGFVVIDYEVIEGQEPKLKVVYLNPIQIKEIYMSDDETRLEGLLWEQGEQYIKVLRDVGFQVFRENEETDELVLVSSVPFPTGITFPVKTIYFQKDTSKEYPYGISLVSDTADVAKSIYNQSSWLDEISRNAGFPFLSIPFNVENGQIPGESKKIVGTKNALAYPANSGTPSWVESSGNSAKNIREQISEEIKRAFQVKGLNSFELIDSQAASGVSIKIRNSNFESKAKDFLQNIKSLEEWILSTASIYLNIDDGQYTIFYPNNIIAPDPSGEIQNWLTLLTTAKEQGKQFNNQIFEFVFKKIIDTAFSLSEDEKKLFGNMFVDVPNQTN